MKPQIKEEHYDRYGKCPQCDMYLPEKEWPMQCWWRGILHPNTCPDFQEKKDLMEVADIIVED